MTERHVVLVRDGLRERAGIRGREVVLNGRATVARREALDDAHRARLWHADEAVELEVRPVDVRGRDLERGAVPAAGRHHVKEPCVLDEALGGEELQ